MAKLKIHAGDFVEGNNQVFSGEFILKKKGSLFSSEIIPFSDLEEIALANEDAVKRIGGTIGWGAVGGAVLGPVGLLAGLLLGGKGKDVTFVAKFKDGRKMLATTDSKTYTKILAAVF